MQDFTLVSCGLLYFFSTSTPGNATTVTSTPVNAVTVTSTPVNALTVTSTPANAVTVNDQFNAQLYF